MANTPIVGPHSGSKETLLAFAQANNALRMADVRLFLDELFAQTVFDGFMVAVQSCVETGDERGRGWVNHYWSENLNPGGIGITYSGEPSRTWANGRDAARAMLVHHIAYTGHPLPDAWKDWVALDWRYPFVAQAGFAGTVKVWSDYGNGKWAADPNYFNAIMNREKDVRWFETHAPAPAPTPAPPPAPAPTPAPPPSNGGSMGLSNLPFPLRVSLVDPNQTNQRPGIKQTPKWVNIHETGNRNPGANAKMHEQWQHSGCPGAADVQVGVHFYVDDHEAVQMLPLDEVSWNAGCGDCEGNYAAVSIEICVNSDGDFEQARRHGAVLAAAVLHDTNLGVAAIRSHNSWSGKWCPALLLSYGLWPDEVNLITAAFGAAGAVPAYPAPAPVLVDGKPWDGAADATVNGAVFHAARQTVTANADGVNVRQFAYTKALPLRDPLKQGEQFPVLGWVGGEAVSGEARWWVTATYARVWVGGTTEKPADATSITPAGPGDASSQPVGPVTVNGRVFYPVGPGGTGREVTTADAAHLRKYADEGSASLRDLAKGDKLTAKWWVEGQEVKDADGNPVNVWWVIDGFDGGRLWSGATVEKPF